MTFDISKVSEADLTRFTACWLNSDMTTNWDAASATYDPEGKVKVASFKTVTGRACAKITGEKPKKAASAAGSGGGKRKKAEGEEGAEEEPKAKKGKGGKKAKRTKAEEVEDEEAEGEDEVVKGED